jgi:heptosyltransferase-2
MNILIRAPNWIGDQVLAFYFFYYLRKAYPDAYIASVCVPWVSDIQYRSLIDEVIILERPSGSSFFSKFTSLSRQGKWIGKKRVWDLAISLPDSFSAAWLLRCAKARSIRGYKFEGRGFLLNDAIELPDERFQIKHRATAYLELLPAEAQPNMDLQEFWDRLPENELDDLIRGELARFDDQQEWPTQLTGVRIEPPEQFYWVLAPGATADSRRWPTEYWIGLAQKIAQQTNLVGLVVGGPKEAPVAARLCEIEELRLLDYTARGPIPSLSKVFQKASFTVTNESGLAHVAAFFGSFTQIVCGAADPRRTKPVGPGFVQVSLNAVDCWPCERNYCSQPVETTIQCLKGIKPETVWEEIKRGLRKVTR